MSREAAFWDSSALVPLCLEHQATARHRALGRATWPVVWWASVIEIQSAIHREFRFRGPSSSEHRGGSLARLQAIRLGWREIAPTEAVRTAAAEVLANYNLRAADALQLAAALVWCGQRPQHRKFLAADQRLGQAAAAAGFEWVQI